MKKIILLLILAFFIFSSCENVKAPKIKTTLYQIKVGGRYGLIDSIGNIVVNPQFDDIYIPYHDNNYDLIAVRLGTKIGFINRKGQFKINPQYDIDTTTWKVAFGTEFSEGLAKVEQNKLYGYIDTSGKMVVKTQFEDCNLFKEGFASFKKNKKWGFIDKTGKIIIQPQFDQADYFKNGIAEIRKFTHGDDDYPSLFGYVNKKGKVIWQPTN